MATHLGMFFSTLKETLLILIILPIHSRSFQGLIPSIQIFPLNIELSTFLSIFFENH